MIVQYHAAAEAHAADHVARLQAELDAAQTRLANIRDYRWGDINAAVDMTARAEQAERERDELIEENRRLREALEDFAERDCEYGDNCPTFGTRHGTCTGCKARAALAGMKEGQK